MRIMAVDDELDTLTRMERELKNVNPTAEVVTFQDADDALAFAQDNTIDIAFLDIELGTASGVDVAKKIKETQPFANIVFCTGFAEYMSDAFEISASDYLMKPVTEEKIHHAMDSLRHPPEFRIPKDKLFFRCFGNFEVFFHEKPLGTLSKRAKELLAYLVFKQGSMCTSRSIIEDVFGDLSESYFRVARKDLEDALTRIGMNHILIKKWGRLGIDASAITCDWYEYIKGNPEVVNLYNGTFMVPYKWASDTVIR